MVTEYRFQNVLVKADFHSVEFSDWTGSLLFTCKNVALNLSRMLRVSNVLLCQIQPARKILLSGNQPLEFRCQNLPFLKSAGKKCAVFVCPSNFSPFSKCAGIV